MSAPSARDGLRRITVAQGDTLVSDEPDVVLTTVLGSCVAACFYDPVAQVGGINHYLLADGNASDTASMQRSHRPSVSAFEEIASTIRQQRAHL